MPDLPPQIQEWMAQLPKGLWDHLQRVRRIAGELAQRHGVDVDRADVAAACHDLARGLKGEALIEEAKRLGIEVGLVEERLPILLHGPVAATWMEREMGITDPEVLQAVYYHSTGVSNMSAIAKVVFIADKIDDHKVDRRPHLDKIRRLAYEDMDRAVLEYMDGELVSYIRDGGVIHPATIDARNELLARNLGRNR